MWLLPASGYFSKLRPLLAGNDLSLCRMLKRPFSDFRRLVNGNWGLTQLAVLRARLQLWEAIGSCCVLASMTVSPFWHQTQPHLRYSRCEAGRDVAGKEKRVSPWHLPELSRTKSLKHLYVMLLFMQNLDVKESGKKSHGRSLMANFGKHKV